MVLPSKGILFYLRILLIAVYFVNGIIIIKQNSIVYDEMDHWSYGKRILKRQPEKIYTYDDASAMPVSAMNAVPRAVEQLLNPGLSKTDGGFSDIMHGRYVTLLLCLLTGLYIYSWSKELFGEAGGTFSLFLFVFCPNLNAHGTLLTTDAYGALFTLSTFYYFRKFLNSPGWKYFIFFSLSLGLSQLVKQSLTHLFLIFFLLSLVILIKRKTIFTGWRRNLLRLIVLAGMVVFIINIGFLFNGSGKSLNQYELVSNSFNRIKSSLSFIGTIPIPLPSPYIQGLDYSVQMDEIGPGDPRTSGQVYILGEKRKGAGFWYYYFVLLLFKIPLSVLIMFIISVALLIGKMNRKIPESLLLLFPITYFIVYFSFFYNSQVGLRHIIMIFPFMYILIGRIMHFKFERPWKKIAVAIACLYSVATYYYYFPNLISYTNELVANKKMAYKIMSDTNLDYGQGQFWLEDYLKNHPGAKLADSLPAAGTMIIGVNDFIDIYDRHNYDWLNKNFEPVAHLKHCYLIFNIREDALKARQLIP